MRFAILTDIHANREAFAAVLDDLAGRQVDRIVLLGDLVGYGPDPEWCTDRAMALVEAGAIAVKGNHDAAISTADDTLNPVARQALDWTRTRLAPAQKAFLAARPMTASEGEVLFVHASAQHPEEWNYVTSDMRALPSFRACAARVILVGHVHVPQLYSCDRTGIVREQRVPEGGVVPLIRSRRWLAVVGSVGQPRDGGPLAGYAILDTATDELTFRRLPYQAAITAQKVRAAGLPESLAQRLLKGA